MSDKQIIAVNRRARHDYEIMETYDAGLVLTGAEIKSIRARRVNLREAYARVEHGDAWIHNLHIAPYEPASQDNLDPMRTRKLLLHRREIDRLSGRSTERGLTIVALRLYLQRGYAKIDRLAGRSTERGLTIVALRLYLQRGYAKIELGLGRGRRQWDKRRAIAEREARREEHRALSPRHRGRTNASD